MFITRNWNNTLETPDSGWPVGKGSLKIELRAEGDTQGFVTVSIPEETR
jgi:hypothetical protein